MTYIYDHQARDGWLQEEVALWWPNVVSSQAGAALAAAEIVI